jgi:5-methylcytosine-specific restriction endonuclease McrA
MLKVKRIQLGKQAYRRLLKRVLERDGWRCQKCGSLRDLQVHHRTYCSRRGDDSLANLVTLCEYCHMEEHGQLSYSRAAAKAKPGAKSAGPSTEPNARRLS